MNVDSVMRPNEGKMLYLLPLAALITARARVVTIVIPMSELPHQPPCGMGS